MILACPYPFTQRGSGGPDVLTSISCVLEMRNFITEQEKKVDWSGCVKGYF